MSAGDSQIPAAWARRVREELIGTLCLACDRVTGADSGYGVYITPDGQRYMHLLCGVCSTAIENSDAEHARIAGIIELRLSKPAGSA